MKDYILRETAVKIAETQSSIHDIIFALKTVPGKVIPAIKKTEKASEGIYIRNLKMPPNCHMCLLCIGGSCPVCDANLDGICPDRGRPEWCPLVPVPEHGRLIDADEMFVEFVIEGQRSKRYKIGDKWELNGEEIRSVISRLPTVIPAEEGET